MPIMLIDDMIDVLEPITIWLRHAGYDVYAFDDARSALQALREGMRPSLIILDLHMPEMDGMQFREAQLNDSRWSAIPVVVMSGHYFTEQDKARLGAVRILEKPVNADTLLAIIRAHRVPLASAGVGH